MRWLLVILLLPVLALGQTYTRTNDILYLTPEDALGGEVLRQFVYEGVATISGEAVDLTGMTVVGRIEGGSVTTYYDATITDATGGAFRVSAVPLEVLDGAFKVSATLNGEPFGLLAWHNLAVSNVVAVFTNQVVTNTYGPTALSLTTIENNFAPVNINSNRVEVAAEVDASISEGAFAGANFSIINNTTVTGIVGVAVTTNDAPAGVSTNEDGVATINIPPGGGGVAKLEGQYGIITTTNGEIVTVSLPTPANAADQFLRSNGSNVFWSTDRFPLPSVGTNYVTFNAIGAVQDWVVSNAVSNVVIYAWGGGGGGNGAASRAGAGGYSEVWHPVTAGETLKVVVANSGHAGSSITSGSGWPGGGTNSASLYAFGGGFSGVYRTGTNWNDLAAEYLIIAPGGGANIGSLVGGGGGGGGLLGQDGADSLSAGKGGTQTDGGLGWNSQTNNFAGSRFYGGGGAGAGIAGGGGGYYGGGAGTNAVNYYSAGGGSGWIGTNALYGITIQAPRSTTPFTDNPYYLSGRALPSGSTVLIPGQVTIRW